MGPSAVIKEVIERSPRMKSKQSLESTRSATLLLIFTHEMLVTKTESWIISSEGAILKTVKFVKLYMYFAIVG